jgi:hypothetical protein
MNQINILHRIKAPELEIESWLNTSSPISLSDFLGKTIVLHSFQMLCPGCILHGLPQTQKIADYFDSKDVQVIGLHTVFEHHEAMQRKSLEAFLYEFKYSFPVGIDRASVSESPIPITMDKYGFRGTPSLVLIDKQGYIAKHYFGSVSDLELGSEITKLVQALV